MQISDILDSVGDNEFEEKVLKVFNRIDVPADSRFMNNYYQISLRNTPWKAASSIILTDRLL